MKCMHVCAAQKPDFPALADEIAKPHPDMNIKVAAFTVSEKSSNTHTKRIGIYFCLQQFSSIFKYNQYR